MKQKRLTSICFITLNIMLFVNCKDGDEAAAVFDSCGFARRSDWKIFLELGSQPA